MSRWRRWLLDHLPAGVLARPDELLIAFLCLSAGFGAASGTIRVDSPYALLPSPLYHAWGWVLLIGATALITGIASMERAAPGYIVKQAAVYRLGQRLLFTGGAFYALCVAAIAGISAVVVSLFLFSLARGVRLLTMGDNGEHH